MQEAAPNPSHEGTRSTRLLSRSQRHRGGILVGGTLIVLIGAGIGMQVWRAQSSNAAEQKTSQAAGQVRMDELNQPVARVNGEAVSWEMLARECVERHGSEVLENLINRKVIQQACAEQGVTVSEAEVNQEVITLSKKFGLDVEQYYQLLQAERNLTPVQYRRDVVWPMLAMKKLAGQDVSITNDMMREAYEDNFGERVKVRMIVFDNLRHAQDAWEKARRNPEDFERMARDLSVEPNSRALGGIVPPIRQHTGAEPELRKAAFAMQEPGEISAIVQSGSRYVVMKYEGRTEPVEHKPEDVRPQLHAELEQREVARLLGETFEKIQGAARVDNLLTGETKGPIRQVSKTSAKATPAAPAVNR